MAPAFLYASIKNWPELSFCPLVMLRVQLYRHQPKVRIRHGLLRLRFQAA
jgi:hypothetical protein